MSTRLSVEEFDTPDALFTSLARVFGVHENNGTRWVTLHCDNVEVTFFATTPSAESLNDEMDSQHEEDPNEGIEVPW